MILLKGSGLYFVVGQNIRYCWFRADGQIIFPANIPGQETIGVIKINDTIMYLGRTHRWCGLVYYGFLYKNQIVYLNTVYLTMLKEHLSLEMVEGITKLC